MQQHLCFPYCSYVQFAIFWPQENQIQTPKYFDTYHKFPCILKSMKKLMNSVLNYLKNGLGGRSVLPPQKLETHKMSH